MQKLLAVLSLAAFLMFVAVTDGRAQQNLGIAATVNDDIITIYDLEARIRLVVASTGMPRTQETTRRLAPQILRALVDEKLKLQEAASQGVEATDEDIDQALMTIASRNKKDSIEAMMQDLERRGVPSFTLREEVTASIAWSRTIGKLAAGRIKASNNEVEQEILRIKRNLGQTTYRVSEIFLPIESPAQEAETTQLATRLHQQLSNGASFPEIARQFSQSGSARQGGDLGWVSTTQLNPAVGAVVAGLQSGQLSQPIKTRDGYYIVAVQDIGTGVRSAGVSEAAQVTLRQIVFPFVTGATSQQRDQTLIAASGNTRDLRSCQAMEQRGQALNSATSVAVSQVVVANLSAQVRQMIGNLPTNTPSTPVASATGATVYMVCERKSNLPSDAALRQRVENRMTQEKLDQFARHKLQDLRRSAFVEVKL